jgi:probable HAF family extracellular repeat protein
MQDLGSLPGGEVSEARGVNDIGQIVGFSSTATGDRAFLWTSTGGMQDLGDLPGGASFSRAYDINNNGQVVGESGAATGTRAFLWTSGGGLEDLGDLPGGSDQSSAIAINEDGQVAGTSSGINFGRAVVWTRDGGMQDLGAPPRLGSTYANGINASGDVVGSGHFPNQLHALLWTSSGGIQELGEFFGGFTYRAANDINDIGQVVGGTSSDGLERSGAFVWTSSNGLEVLSDLLDSSGAGWRLTTATAINNGGQIVGVGENPSGASHAFLLTPIPEPGTWGVAAVALVVGWSYVTRRRRKPAAQSTNRLTTL